MKLPLPLILVLSIAITSLSFKAQRYFHGTNEHIQARVEASLASRVSAGGWDFVDKQALTRLNTSHVMRFKREGCAAPLFVNVLGDDSSDHYFLANYLQIDRARYILAGRELHDLLQLRYYLQHIVDRSQALLSISDTHYSPLIALYQAESNTHCSVDISLLST